MSQRFLRLGWLKLNGEDPVVIRNHWRFMERINSCHCNWIEHLKKTYPDLKDEIFDHETERLNICSSDLDKNRQT